MPCKPAKRREEIGTCNRGLGFRFLKLSRFRLTTANASAMDTFLQQTRRSPNENANLHLLPLNCKPCRGVRVTKRGLLIGLTPRPRSALASFSSAVSKASAIQLQ